MTSVQQKHWLQAKRETEQIVDKRGMPIDKGVLETVTILRLMGLHTVMSCEGHLDRGGGPGVTFEAPDADADRVKVRGYQMMSESEDRMRKIKQLNEKMAKDQLVEKQKLFPYLDAFYQKRQVPYIYRLAIETIGFMSTALCCQGGMLTSCTSLKSSEARKEILAGQQKEMRDFTKLLRISFYRVPEH